MDITATQRLLATPTPTPGSAVTPQATGTMFVIYGATDPLLREFYGGCELFQGSKMYNVCDGVLIVFGFRMIKGRRFLLVRMRPKLILFN